MQKGTPINAIRVMFSHGENARPLVDSGFGADGNKSELMDAAAGDTAFFKELKEAAVAYCEEHGLEY